MRDKFTLSKTQLDNLSLAELSEMHRAAIIGFEQQRGSGAEAFGDLYRYIALAIYDRAPRTQEEFALKVMAMAAMQEPEFPFDRLVADANAILANQNQHGVMQ